MGGSWDAGSEENALEAGVIAALKGEPRRPPSDFADAYNAGYDDASARRPPPDQPLGKVAAHQLAIIGLVHLVIFADSNVDPSEIAWLYEEARYHPVFAGVGFAPFRSACFVALHDLHERSPDELMEIWAGMARPHARATLELAIGAMLADGIVDLPEEGVVARLIARLGLSREEASAIFRETFGLSAKR